MLSSDLIQHLRQLISRNELKDVIQELSRLFCSSPKLDEVILQSARYSKVKAQIRTGVVDYQQANLTENQIRAALLELISEIDEARSIDPVRSEIDRYSQSISGKNIVTGNIKAGGNVNIGDQVTNQLESRSSRYLKIFLYLFVPLLAITLAVYFYKHQVASKSLTLTVHLDDRTPNPHLPFEEGQVSLNYGGEQRSKSIDQELIFTGIPGTFAGQPVQLTFEAVGFQRVDTFFELKGEGLTLPIYRDDRYGRLYGIILDPQTSSPIPNAHIIVDELEAYSNADGTFDLTIPLAKQRRQQRVTVEHPDFETKTVTEPVLPNEQTRIPLHKPK
ncbi:MAG: carboxypeptidase regulatory-like domain-containing protein [Phaeodactylibacter sp.]|nr:carboxypeptidase regulatory-like domain-containing protein [Phaeodactylibacter sp.]